MRIIMHSGIYTTSSASTLLPPSETSPAPSHSRPQKKPRAPAGLALPIAAALFLFLDSAVARPGELILNFDPAPPPEEGPPGAADALRDTAYLPAQIGGLVGAYALSLVLVAAALLLLSKRRRDHINGVDAPKPDIEFEAPTFQFQLPGGHEGKESHFPYPVETPREPVPNFSYPSPVKTDFPRTGPLNTWIDTASPKSPVSACAPGVDIHVDQHVIRQDRQMAQQQLEDLYRYVMEQEEAKENGVVLQTPVVPNHNRMKPATSLKKEKNKPAGLNLQKDEKKESRASSFFNALRSPRGKKAPPRSISISSPLMTPMSATFPRHDEGEEMNAIPPRHYAPPPPPPVPTEPGAKKAQNAGPLTPDHSPESTLSIDERLQGQLPLREGSQHQDGNQPGAGTRGHSRNTSAAPSEPEQPVSAVSERSNSPLVGLPSSPKPGVNRFPSLPQSPKPGQSFSRPNAPTAVRTGGALPLRAYEPSITSPSMSSFQTKQTVFERAGPMSPGMRTPFTGAPVPYSPYQPQTPCIPMTPSLVTKADRKRMKKLEPKTPTLEMVKSNEEIW